MIQTHTGSASGSKTNTGTRPNVVARAASAERARNHRKTRVPRPTHTPAAAPRNAHFNVLIRRAVCSVYQRLSSERRGGSGGEPKRCSRRNVSRHDISTQAYYHGGLFKIQFNGRHRRRWEFPCGGAGAHRFFHRLHHITAIQVRELDGRILGDFEHAPPANRTACDLKGRGHGSGPLSIGDVEKYRVITPAGHHVEPIRNSANLDRVCADMMPIQLHHTGDRLQVDAAAPFWHWNHHGVVLPTRSTEIGGGGDLEHVTVALMIVENPGVRHPRRPR